jgi:hypothetical protein
MEMELPRVHGEPAVVIPGPYKILRPIPPAVVEQMRRARLAAEWAAAEEAARVEAQRHVAAWATQQRGSSVFFISVKDIPDSGVISGCRRHRKIRR